MPTYPLQLTCLGVIYGTPLLASIFVILRIYTRRKLNLRLSWGMVFKASYVNDINAFEQMIGLSYFRCFCQ